MLSPPLSSSSFLFLVCLVPPEADWLSQGCWDSLCIHVEIFIQKQSYIYFCTCVCVCTCRYPFLPWSYCCTRTRVSKSPLFRGERSSLKNNGHCTRNFCLHVKKQFCARSCTLLTSSPMMCQYLQFPYSPPPCNKSHGMTLQNMKFFSLSAWAIPAISLQEPLPITVSFQGAQTYISEVFRRIALYCSNTDKREQWCDTDLPY